MTDHRPPHRQEITQHLLVSRGQVVDEPGQRGRPRAVRQGRGRRVRRHGTFHITEAVRRLRHEAGPAQVVDARRALVTGIGGMLAVHCTLILERAEPS